VPLKSKQDTVGHPQRAENAPSREQTYLPGGKDLFGDVVDVVGTVSTVNGEKVITNANTVQRSETTPLAPLGMANRGMWEGLSNTGLYVEVWGQVDAVGADYFTLTDGSGRLLKVYGSATAGTYVRVTGAAGAEIVAGNTIPVVRSTSLAVTTQR